MATKPLLALVLCLHLAAGTEGFALTTRPHVGMVRHAGSIPAVSTPKPKVDRSASTARQMTVQLARKAKLNQRQIRCLITLWHRESRFNPDARNRHSTAAGIPQILGMKTSSTPREQITQGLRYIKHRYDTPCRALRHHNRYGWY